MAKNPYSESFVHIKFCTFETTLIFAEKVYLLRYTILLYLLVADSTYMENKDEYK